MDGKTRFSKSVIKMATSKQVTKVTKMVYHCLETRPRLHTLLLATLNIIDIIKHMIYNSQKACKVDITQISFFCGSKEDHNCVGLQKHTLKFVFLIYEHPTLSL